VSSILERGKSLRVFMTADAVGGVWQYALDLSRGLSEHGAEITLAVLGPAPSDKQLEEAEKVGACHIHQMDLPLEWTADNAGRVEEASRAVAALAAETEADVVHLNSPALACDGPFQAPVVAVCHSCVATWWQAVRSGPLPPEFQWRTDLVRRGYTAASALIAPSLAFAAATAHTYGLSKTPTVVRNGRRTADLTDRSGQPPERLVFTSGRLWDDGKNVGALDRAASRIGAPVVAAGPLEGPHGARAHFKHLRPVGRLSDDDVRGWLARQPIFVSVSKYEPFGLAVLEAAQAGCALVLSDIPTFRELWDGAAIFVPPEDDAAIAAAVAQLLADPDVRASFGRAAREQSRAYSVEAMTSGVLDVYRSLLPSGAIAMREEAAA